VWFLPFSAQSTFKTANSPFEVISPSAAHVPTHLTTLLQVLVHVAAPSLLCQWFIADLIKKIPETMRDLLDLTLSATCPLPLARRVKSCGEILACSLYLQQLPGYTDQATFFPCFLVRYRLHNGPNDAWDIFDETATYSLQGKPLRGVGKDALHELLRSLCSETWGIKGTKLRVGGQSRVHSSYLINNRTWDTPSCVKLSRARKSMKPTCY
jgi:serine/threonine-protein kinase ATR